MATPPITPPTMPPIAARERPELLETLGGNACKLVNVVLCR